MPCKAFSNSFQDTTGPCAGTNVSGLIPSSSSLSANSTNGGVQESDHPPQIIFTTAYDSYAITAFELHAVDYLLKPFSEDRFRSALERARQLLDSGPSSSGNAWDSLHRTQAALESDRVPDRVFVRVSGKIIPLAIEDIVRLEAQDDYVMIHTEERRHLVHVRLKDMAGRLDPSRFVRIHRSHIANIDWIRSLEPYDGHRLLVEFMDGSSLVASRSGTKVLRELVV